MGQDRDVKEIPATLDADVLVEAARNAWRAVDSTNGDSPLDNVLAGLAAALSCPLAALWELDDDGEHLQLRAHYPEAGASLPTTYTLGQGIVGRAAARQEPQTVNRQAWHSPDAPLGELGVCGGLATPLVWEGQTFGVLAAFEHDPAREFGPADAELAQFAARYAAVLMANERLQQRAEHAEEALYAEQRRLANLQAAVRRILEQPDVDINLIEIAEAFQAMGWQQVILAVYAGDGQVDQLITLGVHDDHREALRAGIVQSTVWELFQAGKLEQYRVGALYFIPATGPGKRWHPDDLLFAPLRLGQGRIVGLIRLGEPANGLRPLSEALRVLDILASQAAYLVENARLLDEKTRTADELVEQVEELSMIHRADRELSSHLNMEQVMTLTMDWALRRTGADTGLLALMTSDRRGLIPFTTMGYLEPDVLTSTEQHPWPLERGMMGRAASTGEILLADDMAPDDEDALMPGAKSQICVPLSMRGEILGVLSLMSSEAGVFGEANVSFLERLAGRAAVALDNARLFRQSEQLADDMSILYSASRAITATLERDEVLQRIAQSLAVALESSSAVILNYRRDQPEAEVLASYRVGTVRDTREILPEVKSVVSLEDFPTAGAAIAHHRTVTLRAADPTLPERERNSLEQAGIQAAIWIPLVAQEELIGVAIVNEGRHDRTFTANEVARAEALASQASVALRQSMLYYDLLQLERIKSEMIRMASHDLRNPLNNILGYLDLITMLVEQENMAPELGEYLASLRRSAHTMQSLIDDLLTLERVESERESDWTVFDLSGLVLEVVEAEYSGAQLKQQTLTYDRPPDTPPIYGSVTQLRQAISNLVGNAIKYTPEGGRIEVRVSAEADRVHLSVVDNGYGIDPNRQARLFERFYRARQPGTESIPGTGLGLSLVKTVVERHGGLVWFESQPCVGSTFGFWLPVAEGRAAPKAG